MKGTFIHNHIFLFCRDIKSGTKIRISQAKTFFRRKPAPVMASYSSRGPNKVQPSILKVFIHLNLLSTIVVTI
jgi:hypothetical protein